MRAGHRNIHTQTHTHTHTHIHTHKQINQNIMCTTTIFISNISTTHTSPYKAVCSLKKSIIISKNLQARTVIEKVIELTIELTGACLNREIRNHADSKLGQFD